MAMLSVKATAVILGVSPQTVRRWCHEGRLKAFRPGGKCNFRIPTWAISNRILSLSPEKQFEISRETKT
jgi:excisionase family DNA binding protein